MEKSRSLALQLIQVQSGCVPITMSMKSSGTCVGIGSVFGMERKHLVILFLDNACTWVLSTPGTCRTDTRMLLLAQRKCTNQSMCMSSLMS